MCICLVNIVTETCILHGLTHAVYGGMCKSCSVKSIFFFFFILCVLCNAFVFLFLRGNKYFADIANAGCQIISRSCTTEEFKNFAEK